MRFSKLHPHANIIIKKKESDPATAATFMPKLMRDGSDINLRAVVVVSNFPWLSR